MLRNDKPSSAPPKTHANAMQAIAIELRTNPPCGDAIYASTLVVDTYSEPVAETVFPCCSVQSTTRRITCTRHTNALTLAITQQRPVDKPSTGSCPCQARTPSVTRS